MKGWVVPREDGVTCFQCPLHGLQSRASVPARMVFAVLCSIAAGLSVPCTIVCEARVVPQVGAYDLIVPGFLDCYPVSGGVGGEHHVWLLALRYTCYYA